MGTREGLALSATVVARVTAHLFSGRQAMTRNILRSSDYRFRCNPRLRRSGISAHDRRHQLRRRRCCRSEEHTSELQSRGHLVCRLLLEKKKKTINMFFSIIKKKKHKQNT